MTGFGLAKMFLDGASSPGRLLGNDLSTRQRLLKWELIFKSLNQCVLSGAGKKTHGRWFFYCAYTAEVWHALLHKIQISTRPFGLMREISWASLQRRDKRSRSTSYKMSLTAPIYALWIKRHFLDFSTQSNHPWSYSQDSYGSQV